MRELGEFPGVAAFRMEIFRPALAVLLLVNLSGCGGDAGGEAPSASASGPKKPAVDAAAYCESSCARATTCGIEAATKISREDPTETKLVADLKNREAQTKAECVAECSAGAANPKEESALAAANRCLEQTTCELFSKCLTEVDVLR